MPVSAGWLRECGSQELERRELQGSMPGQAAGQQPLHAVCMACSTPLATETVAALHIVKQQALKGPVFEYFGHAVSSCRRRQHGLTCSKRGSPGRLCLSSACQMLQ